MNTIIFDMYGVIMKAPEGDLIPYIKSKIPNLTKEFINEKWKEAAQGRIKSYDFFSSMGFIEEIENVEKEYLDTIEIDEEFYTAVKNLKSRYQLVLLSNDISQWNEYLRRKYHLNELFDVIVISGDHGFLKPDVRIFQIIMDRLGVKAADCLYIDDREKNLAAAGQLGMNVILFNRRNIVYDGMIINSFHELLQYMEGKETNN